MSKATSVRNSAHRIFVTRKVEPVHAESEFRRSVEQLGGVDLWRNSVDLVIIGFGASPAACYCTFFRLKIVDPPCNTKYKHQQIFVPHSIPKILIAGCGPAAEARGPQQHSSLWLDPWTMVWHVTCPTFFWSRFRSTTVTRTSDRYPSQYKVGRNASEDELCGLQDPSCLDGRNLRCWWKRPK